MAPRQDVPWLAATKANLKKKKKRRQKKKKKDKSILSSLLRPLASVLLAWVSFSLCFRVAHLESKVQQLEWEAQRERFYANLRDSVRSPQPLDLHHEPPAQPKTPEADHTTKTFDLSAGSGVHISNDPHSITIETVVPPAPPPTPTQPLETHAVPPQAPPTKTVAWGAEYGPIILLVNGGRGDGDGGPVYRYM